MDGPSGPPREIPDRQAERWLTQLRDGTPPQQAEARRELSAIFAARGMTTDAIELLVANARAGYRDADQFETLARLYRAIGNEYLAASAALEAARLRERGPVTPPPPNTGRGGGRPHGPRGQHPTGQHPYGQQGVYRPPQFGPAPSQPPRPSVSRTHGEPSTSFLPVGPRWERPLRISGWVLFAGIVVGALASLGTSPVAAVAYAVAAGALGLLLAGARGLRRSLRVPTGPLGDGALLFVALLLFLTGGAMLPRSTGSDVPPVTAPPARTPGPLYLGTPTPLTRAPTVLPTASPQPAATLAAAVQAAPAATAQPPPQAPASAGASVAAPGPAPPSPPPSTPPTAPAADMGALVRIVNAGNEGVRLRPAPGAEEVLKVLAEGTTLVSLGEEQEDGGRQWRRVRDQDGQEGWVAADFLAAAAITPTAVAAAPTRPPTIVTAAIVPPTQPPPPVATKPQATVPATTVSRPQAAAPATSAPKPQAAPPPTPTPAARPPAAKAAPSGYNCPASHPIKGNHSSRGEWIYHVPGGQFYGATQPEDCFATPEDARRAGYRPSQR